MLILSTNVTFAHCDTMDGPLIADARKALGKNNVNYVLKWVSAANESEIRDAFNFVMKVRKNGSGTVEIDDEIKEVPKDTLIVSPANIPHGWSNNSNSDLRFLVVKTPNRFLSQNRDTVRKIHKTK